MMIDPPKIREIDRAILKAQRRRALKLTAREVWLLAHHEQQHTLTALDNHDQCSCGATFYRPRPPS